MRLKLYIDCNNASFEGDLCATVLARILRDYAEEIEEELGAEGVAAHVGTLSDSNGNTVGKVTVDEGVFS